jgi:hypothetical protein
MSTTTHKRTIRDWYYEGETDTEIDGVPIMWEDASDTLRVVSSTKPLPVNTPLLSEADGDDVRAYPGAIATGGATPYSYISSASATSQDSVNVKASAGTLYGISAFSVSGSPCWLKIYDKASTAGVADTPKVRHLIPGATTGDGAIKIYPVGLEFSNGISIRLTTGIADSDATGVGSSFVAVNLDYE